MFFAQGACMLYPLFSWNDIAVPENQRFRNEVSENVAYIVRFLVCQGQRCSCLSGILYSDIRSPEALSCGYLL